MLARHRPFIAYAVISVLTYAPHSTLSQVGSTQRVCLTSGLSVPWGWWQLGCLGFADDFGVIIRSESTFGYGKPTVLPQARLGSFRYESPVRLHSLHAATPPALKDDTTPSGFANADCLHPRHRYRVCSLCRAAPRFASRHRRVPRRMAACLDATRAHSTAINQRDGLPMQRAATVKLDLTGFVLTGVVARDSSQCRWTR